MTAGRIAPRHVGILLGLGIVILPGIFVWFLLRRGHSPVARIAGFSWAALVLAIWLSSTPTPAGPSAEAVVQQQVAGPAALNEPSPEPSRLITPRAELSQAARQMKRLHEELNTFRSNPEFHRVGFSRCCRFSDWKRRVEELDSRSGPGIMRETGVSPRELLQLGFEYMHNDGEFTELAQRINSRFAYALSPAVPEAAGGRTTREGWWCRDIELWFAALRATEQGDYARADSIHSEPACPHVLVNTLTGPELERRYYTAADGTSRLYLIRVRLADGTEVWAPLDDVEFAGRK